MRLRPEQLDAHLRRTLAPLYVVVGDEPLQAQEACDAVRTAALASGVAERLRLVVEPGFDWDQLQYLAQSPSLFASKRLIELRLDGAKAGDGGSRALRRYAEHPPVDAVLLVSAGKQEAAIFKSAWWRALERVGVVIQVYPLDIRQLPTWLRGRLAAKGIEATHEVAELMALRCEGHLLAAAQEIDKLVMAGVTGSLDADTLLAAVGDHARFSVFDLAEAALAGETQRAVRIVDRLRDEGIDPILGSWVLHREIRLLNGLLFARRRGIPLERALESQGVWERRKPLWRSTVKRFTLDRARRLLERCARLDQTLKGAERLEAADGWGEVLGLTAAVAGGRLAWLADPFDASVAPRPTTKPTAR
ncbi:MAG: DNA polymerase III subunit delta [Candidatus Competibacterales bacterium]